MDIRMDGNLYPSIDLTAMLKMFLKSSSMASRCLATSSLGQMNFDANRQIMVELLEVAIKVIVQMCII